MNDEKPARLIAAAPQATRLDISTYVLPEADDEISSVRADLKTLRKNVKKLRKQVLREASYAIQEELDANLTAHLEHDSFMREDQSFSPPSNPRLQICIPLGKQDGMDRKYDVNLFSLVHWLIEDNRGDEESLRLWGGTFLMLAEKLQAAVEATIKESEKEPPPPLPNEDK